uniref:Uncharacterized protein n=1 Tax=Picea glauca TaxID=3330 RepID=A0A117NJC8_PICGL|nr:hypothetical protein ABT39_MTgene1095 [Picea glauca]
MLRCLCGYDSFIMIYHIWVCHVPGYALKYRSVRAATDYQSGIGAPSSLERYISCNYKEVGKTSRYVL